MLLKEPNDPFLRYAMAMEHIGLEQLQEALDLLDALRRSDPDYHATYYHLAKLYEKTDQRDAAIAAYEQGLEVCKRKGEDFALRELRSAYDELLFD